MAVAVATTLLLDGIGNWALIAIGLGIGTAVGVIASRRVQMTAMPQMVALYNGVGGGAVALIAWAEFRHRARSRRLDPPRHLRPDPVLDGHRVGLVLGVADRVRQAPGHRLRPAGQGAGPAIHKRHPPGRNRRCLRRPGCRPRLGAVAGALHRRPHRRGDPWPPLRIADRWRGHAGGHLASERLHRPFSSGGRDRARQRRPDRRRHPRRLLGNDLDARDGDGDEPVGRQYLLLGLRRAARRGASPAAGRIGL